MKKKSLFLVLFVVLALGLSLNGAEESPSKKGVRSVLDKVKQQQKDILSEQAKLRKMLSTINEDIKKRNLSFKAKITEMMKHKIAEITGAKIPSKIEDEAKRKEEENKKKDKKDKIKPIDKKEQPSPTLKVFSWDKEGKVTPVKHQHECGSCWSFTSMAVLEANYMIKKDKKTDLSEQTVLDCAENNDGSDAGSCEGGWYGGVFDYLSARGVPSEKALPYKNSSGKCQVKKKSPKQVKAWGYVKSDAGIPSVKKMKEALCKYGPLAATVKVTPAFQAYDSGVFDELPDLKNEKDVNHAITITGWDDAKQAYRVKNSWGTEWGEDGYVWVKYNCNNIGYGAAWVVVD